MSERSVPFDLDAVMPRVPEERRVVWVPVRGLDARALKTVHHALRIPAAKHQAVHVVDCRKSTIPLAIGWMEADLPLPLIVIDRVGGLAPSIRGALESGLAGDVDEVVVLLSQVVRQGRWSRLATSTADRVERELSGLPGVRVLVLGVRGE